MSDSLIELFKFWACNLMAEEQYIGSHYGIA